MIRKIKCKVCGNRFEPERNIRYTATAKAEGLARLTTKITYFDAFDCPKCGCQIIVGEREAIP